MVSLMLIPDVLLCLIISSFTSVNCAAHLCYSSCLKAITMPHTLLYFLQHLLLDPEWVSIFFSYY